MAARKRSSAQEQLRVVRDYDEEPEVPYKKRIMSEYFFKDDAFWKEGEDLVFNTGGGVYGNVQMRAGFDDLRNQLMVYFKKDYATKEGKTDKLKPSFVTLERKQVQTFLDWLDLQISNLEDVEFPDQLESLEQLGEDGLVSRTKTGVLISGFFEKGEVLNLGNFRAKLAYDSMSGSHKVFINTVSRSATFTTWNGPTIELNLGVAQRMTNQLKHLDSLF